MHLVAQPSGLFTSRLDLLLDGRLVGELSTRFAREGFDIARWRGSEHLALQKKGLAGQHLLLLDAPTERVLGEARPMNFASRRWRLSTRAGELELRPAGFLSRSWTVLRPDGDIALGRVGRRRWLGSGWEAEASGDIPAEDLLLVGLVYLAVLNRQLGSLLGGLLPGP